MTYTNSKLVSYTRLSPNKTSPRKHIIDTITIHCMAGNLSIEACGTIFANKARQVSSNYGIGSDGRIALYVNESDRSWCSSNKSNDHRAVTIEVANDGGAPDWHVSDKAMNSLINLVTDICKRNNIKELKWQGNKNLIGQIDKQNMTVHRWFAAKACPGNYLYNKHCYIANEVNKKLGIQASSSSEISTQKYIYNGVDYSLVFNPTYYANKYTDLKETFGYDTAALFNHFVRHGMKEGRQAIETFNVFVYKNNYTDLIQAFGNDISEYYKHYIQYGYSEGRTGTN